MNFMEEKLNRKLTISEWVDRLSQDMSDVSCDNEKTYIQCKNCPFYNAKDRTKFCTGADSGRYDGPRESSREFFDRYHWSKKIEELL